MFIRKVQEMMYNKASSPEDLPWHREEISPLIMRALEGETSGRVLDLGCGSGVFSVHLAAMGYDVVGIDYIPRAIEMAKARGEAARVDVEWLRCDLFEWQPKGQFDLILDSGCLHSLIGADLHQYKARILRWLSPNGHYVLEHWGRRHVFDWRPVGPTRRTRRELVDLFAPELVEREYQTSLMTGIDLPIGPTVLGQGFWFRPASAAARTNPA